MSGAIDRHRMRRDLEHMVGVDKEKAYDYTGKGLGAVGEIFNKLAEKEGDKKKTDEQKKKEEEAKKAAAMMPQMQAQQSDIFTTKNVMIAGGLGLGALVLFKFFGKGGR